MIGPGRDDISQDVFAEVPEADAAEQAVPAVPGDDTLETDTPQPPPATIEADPADAWDQALAVPDLDDDYQHDEP